MARMTANLYSRAYARRNPRIVPPISQTQPREQKLKRPRLWYSPSIREWAVLTPYIDKQKNKEFNFMLELQCDASYKSSVKAWTFEESKLEKARELLAQYFGLFDEQERIEIPVCTPVNALDKHMCDFKELVGLPQELELTFVVAKSAYRHTAALLHPDRGGDASKMSELNVAWQEIRDSLS